MHFFKQYLQYYPEAKVGIKEKCKNHKKNCTNFVAKYLYI